VGGYKRGKKKDNERGGNILSFLKGAMATGRKRGSKRRIRTILQRRVESERSSSLGKSFCWSKKAGSPSGAEELSRREGLGFLEEDGKDVAKNADNGPLKREERGAMRHMAKEKE